MENKKYYWLKLPTDWFNNKLIKRLRRIAGGDTYTIIYLKMLLKALEDDGKLYFDELEETFADELALDLDEDSENVKVTVNYLLKSGLLQMNDTYEYQLPQLEDMTGSETASAKRVRKSRERQKMLQCNTDVTPLKQLETKCNTEIEIEKEIEKDNIYGQKSKRFSPPTLEDIQAYCQERKNNVDAVRFFDFYSSKGWMVGKNKMKDWKASVRTWEKNERVYSNSKSQKNEMVYSHTKKRISDINEREYEKGQIDEDLNDPTLDF